jgi:hypothetical protein
MDVPVPNIGSLVVSLDIRVEILKKRLAVVEERLLEQAQKLGALDGRISLAEDAVQALDTPLKRLRP